MDAVPAGMSELDMPHHGMVFQRWIGTQMPHTISLDVSLVILHSIVPYEPRKRARDAEEA